MSMIAVSLALLFAVSAMVAFVALVSSYARAFAAFGEVRRALARCESRRAFLIGIEEMERMDRQPGAAPLRAPVILRLVSSAPADPAGPATAWPELRAAA